MDVGSTHSMSSVSNVRVMLEERIRAFAALVSLLLVLLTLFTAQRATAIDRLWGPADHLHPLRETLLSLALAVTTIIVFILGLRLWVDAADHFSLWARRPVISAYVATWLLLVPLIVWQLSLFWRACSAWKLLSRQKAG
jgi:hypothetical protein